MHTEVIEAKLCHSSGSPHKRGIEFPLDEPYGSSYIFSDASPQSRWQENGLGPRNIRIRINLTQVVRHKRRSADHDW